MHAPKPQANRRLHRLAAAVAAATCLALGGPACTPAQYAQQADKAAYGVIKQKQGIALGETRPFDITYNPLRPVREPTGQEEILVAGKAIPLGQAPPRKLTLNECLEIAVRSSRSLQTRKEQLFSSALALANLRHQWSLLSGDLLAEAATVRTVRGDSTHSGTAQADLSFAQRFANGGILTLAASLDAITNFLNIRDTSFGSFLDANLTQPLIRGAWRGFAYEELYRAERDFAYAVLEYERFTQDFSVGIATSYHDVLRREDELQNERDNLARLRVQAKFNEAQVKAGLLRRVDADLAEQDVLSAEARVQSALQRYLDVLDSFKISLGLPIVASIELDKAELEQLRTLPIPFPEQEAVRIAMRTRPDVLIQHAIVRDALRNVEIAADQFNPALDLALDISVRGTEPRKPFRVASHRSTRAASLSFDYALDQTNNRDEYRNALIDLSRARRELEGFLDDVRLQVRQSYRALEQSEQTYRIQKAAVALAERRTKLTRLEQKEGLASTREVLEAEDALRSSKNALTSALVSYTTTRLSFLANLGMISVDQQGRIHERNEPFYFDRYLRPERGQDDQ